MEAAEDLASVIVAAAEIREKSYNFEAADKAIDENRIIDFGQFYQKTLRESCKIASKDYPNLLPILLLLKNSWDEALEWAEKILTLTNNKNRR